MIVPRYLWLSILSVVTLTSCNNKEKPFQRLRSSYTNITFNNLITESDSLNVLGFEYIYNGSGVGVGDFNNDGLTDIFFGGNMVSSKLYLNKGDFKFEDVTKSAGVETGLWCTGISLADINQDGLLDIYISTVHPNENKKSPNLLFIQKEVNANGIPTFEEVAAKVGLADSSYSTQAAFLDYDLDGDLDMYLLNNALENYSRNTPIGQRTDGQGKSVDRLYRCDSIGNGLPHFTDVSRESGILAEGWGLGVVVNDVNRDGYPDVYVANDFLSNDHLLINNQDGTFTNRIAEYLKHQEYNGMGVDAADINNDGYNDIVAMDMMPDDNLRQKTMFPNIGYDRFMLNLQKGYQPQYVRNVLQLNNGNGSFSDIGYLAGINATDWSWSSLLADFDNDGFRDLLITNGYRKDVTDLDFIAYSRESSMFGTDKTRLEKAIATVNDLKGVLKPNFMFRNNGDLTFTNEAIAWGLDQPSFSNGAAYADFDNDGDLDLVMNNVNDEAFIYRNNLTKEKPGNYLQLKFLDVKGNLSGLGAKVSLYAQGKMFYAEHQTQRGYKSTVEATEHFGLGKITTIDSIIVEWQTGKRQVLKNVLSNQLVTLEEKDASSPGQKDNTSPTKAIFAEVHTKYNVYHRPSGDEDFVDFKQGQALLPQKYSQLGPGVAVGDINEDGLEDFIVGAPKGKAATIFYQQSKGIFKKDSLPNKIQEDLGLLLFDADNDNDLDLYCVSGSSEFGRDTKNYQDRFYRNNGKGKFNPDSTALPNTESSGSGVTANDFDKDGDLDLFVGGRILPLRYPESPESYLLMNDGKGIFKNATPTSLQKIGLVTTALWTDFDNDSWTDLVVVGEWMPVTFFKNKNGQLEKYIPKKPTPETTVGWWNSIASGDFDNDGDIDYVAGNVGLNSLYKASLQEPVCVYAKDFDENGSLDPILCRYVQGTEYITHPRETLTEQMVSMRRVLPRYVIHGNSPFQKLFPEEKLKGALIYKSTMFTSTYIENLGDGNFNFVALPTEAQVSPLFGINVTDFNGDGNLDILAVGNSYSTEPLTGYYDAGIGVCLQGDGSGNFKIVNVTQSGFFVDGDAKALAAINLGQNKSAWIATANRDSVKIFEHSEQHDLSTIKILADDAYAEIIFTDGKKRRQEFNYGSSYLSQSSRVLVLTPEIQEVQIVNVKGQRRKLLPN
jgi:enediyne biosynthesis protein E4